MKPTEALDLDAIEARCEAAEQGPWEAEWVEFDGFKIDDVAGNWDYEVGGIIGEANAQFIAHARTDVPALIAALRERDAVIARVREVLRVAEHTMHDIAPGVHASDLRAALEGDER